MGATTSLDVAFVVYITSVMFGVTIQLMYMIRNRREIKNFIITLEQFVTVSKWSIIFGLNTIICDWNANSFKHILERICWLFLEMIQNIDNKFSANEVLVTKLSSFYRNFVISSTTLYCTVPAVKQFVAYMTDNVTPTTYLAPFRDMYGDIEYFI